MQSIFIGISSDSTTSSTFDSKMMIADARIEVIMGYHTSIGHSGPICWTFKMTIDCFASFMSISDCYIIGS